MPQIIYNIIVVTYFSWTAALVPTFGTQCYEYLVQTSVVVLKAALDVALQHGPLSLEIMS